MEALNFIVSIGPVPATCFIIGFVLLIFEMFHPGFGVPGIIGLVLLLLGVVLTARTMLEGLVMIIVILVILGLAFSFVLNSATKGYLSKKLILSNTSRKESGYIGTEDLSYFLGKEGMSTSVLRPAGRLILTVSNWMWFRKGSSLLKKPRSRLSKSKAGELWYGSFDSTVETIYSTAESYN